jgi:transcription initiation factor TFIIB
MTRKPKTIRHIETGEEISVEDGSVIGQELDRGPPRAFEWEKRKGPETPLIYDKGISSVIDGDYPESGLNSKFGPDIRRLKKLHHWTTISWNEKNILRALGVLETLSGKLHIPKHIVEEASNIYRAALKEGFVSGRRTEGIAIGAMRAAGMKFGKWLYFKELFDSCGVPPELRKLYKKYYRDLMRKFRIRAEQRAIGEGIKKICGKLGVGPKVKRAAYELARYGEESKMFSGRDPRVVDGACVYYAYVIAGSKEDEKTQRHFAEAAGISLVSFTKMYGRLKKMLGLKSLSDLEQITRKYKKLKVKYE